MIQATIFVSIAAYRDPQLAATVSDCLEKARHPERLRFGICWQHGEDELLPGWFGGEQFTVIDIPFKESRGLCWARAVIMDVGDGEDWYLQLDSHHRFAPSWDAKLIDQAAETGSAKPVLSTFAPPFWPDQGAGVPTRATKIEFGGFAAEGDLQLRGAWSTQESTRPVRARFLSAHFVFAPGSFVEDVPYDPELYYLGEETSLALRAFTHGYDLFHPGIPIVSHEYTRAGRPKHWTDHISSNGIAVQWQERNALSRMKIERLLQERSVSQYGLGTEWTFSDYESYAGIDFRGRRIQECTRQGNEPPNPPKGSTWIEVGPPSSNS